MTNRIDVYANRCRAPAFFAHNAAHDPPGTLPRRSDPRLLDLHYVRLHTGPTSHLLRDRLGSIEAKLDPAVFVRVHRSTIVNVTRIREMHPMFNGDQLLVLVGGRRVTVSRTFRARLLERL